MENISLDFEQAKAKHLLFKSKLRSVLYGLEEADTSVLSHFECAMGKWIYSYALKAYGHIPEMQQLEQVHANIHTSARKLVALYQSGKVDEARHGLADMEKIADQLVELLTTIETKIKNQPEPNEGVEEAHSKVVKELLLKNQQLDVKIKEESTTLSKEKNLLRNFFMQAPAIFAILKGPNHIFELANPAYIELIGNRNPVGKPVREAVPELEGQGFYELLDHVYTTGEPFVGKEILASLMRNGKLDQVYFNFNYQVFNDDHGKIEGILVFAYEVTEQVIARKKIEDSEQRFSNILSQSLMAIAIFKGTEMKVTFANDPMIDVLGKGNGILHKPLLEGVPELEGQAFPKLLADVYTTGEPYYGYETKAVLVRNGKPEDVYFNFVYQPFREVDNTITGVTVLATDVTEQVLSKKKMIESEQRLLNILEQAPDPILILKGENMIVEIANEPQLKLWGADKSVLGKPVFEIAPELKDQGFTEMLQEVYHNGKIIRGHETPVTFIGKDGIKTTHYFDFYFQPYRDADGHISGVMVMAFNVTKQVETGEKIKEYSENLKRFKYMADNATEPFILMRKDGTFAYLNDVALERWGYTREEAEHLRVPDVDPVYNDDVFNQAFAKAQIEKLPQFETLHKKKDGTIYPVEINMGALTLNEKPHLFAIARDITTRKKAEEKLKLYYEDLEVKVKFRNIALERENKELKNKIEELSKDKK